VSLIAIGKNPKIDLLLAKQPPRSQEIGSWDKEKPITSGLM